MGPILAQHCGLSPAWSLPRQPVPAGQGPGPVPRALGAVDRGAQGRGASGWMAREAGGWEAPGQGGSRGRQAQGLGCPWLGLGPRPICHLYAGPLGPLDGGPIIPIVALLSLSWLFESPWARPVLVPGPCV